MIVLLLAIASKICKVADLQHNNETTEVIIKNDKNGYEQFSVA